VSLPLPHFPPAAALDVSELGDIPAQPEMEKQNTAIIIFL
jgi:hypothetical protein